jgi:hypothetical protein
MSRTKRQRASVPEESHAVSDDQEIGLVPPTDERTTAPAPGNQAIGLIVVFGCAVTVLMALAALAGGVVGIWRWALN